MEKGSNIEKKLASKEYIETLQQEKYEKIITTRITEDYEYNIDEVLDTKEALDSRTLNKYKKELPGKIFLKKFREADIYLEYLKNFVIEKEDEYERRLFYFQKVELDEPLEQSIIGKEFGSEPTVSKFLKDDEGNFYILKKLPAGIATDEIEAEVLNKKLRKTIEKGREKLIKRVKNLNFSNLNDLQHSSTFKAFLDFYEKYPSADLQFNQFFSKQYDLFSQLLDKRIEVNEFSTELKELLDIVYAIIEFKNDKYEE